MNMHSISEHTLHELQIIPERHQENSIFHYFNKTVSYGGRDFLKRMIKQPRQSLSEIRSVQDLLKSIGNNPGVWEIDISHAYIAATENYINSNIAHTMSQDVFQHWFQTMMFSIRQPEAFSHIQSGLSATLRFFRVFREMVFRVRSLQANQEITDDLHFLESFFNSFVLKPHLTGNAKSPSKKSVFYLDYYLRNDRSKEFRKVLDIYYKLDAFIAIVKTSNEHNLCFPEFNETVGFETENSWHPLITGSTKNSFILTGDPGICLLTGANTSGKTTFLKSTGIIIYLAHLGWPVPAEKLRLGFIDRLFTSIHLSDNIDLGYSHFYNEVMRVKEIAEALHDGEKCFILIDELFRGTNQEDALHCSQTVLDGFANFENSLFVISTHLLEFLERYLKSPAVSFQCFKTIISNGSFENTFLLETGIATEKVGKLIMEQAGVPELLRTKKPSLS